MREFPVKFDEGITRGLRPYAKMPRNYQSLTDAVNFRVTKRGPEVPPTIVTPASWAALGTAWPYPRVFRTGHRYLLMDDDALYLIDPDTLAISTPLISSITTRGLWAPADFGDFSALYDGSETGLYFRRDIGTGADSDAYAKLAFGTGARGPRAVCNFRQQFLMGGTGTGVYRTGYGWSPEQVQWRNVVFWAPIGAISTRLVKEIPI